MYMYYFKFSIFFCLRVYLNNNIVGILKNLLKKFFYTKWIKIKLLKQGINY